MIQGWTGGSKTLYPNNFVAWGIIILSNHFLNETHDNTCTGIVETIITFSNFTGHLKIALH
jgi:hypothetical protein